MTSDRRSEREKAAYGPRSLKEPGSPEWCWQTLDALVADYKLIDERFDEVGGALSQLKDVQAWKVIPTNKPYGSLGRMLAIELGIDSKTIQHEIDQARKRRKLGQQGGARAGAGRPKKGENRKTNNQGDNITLNKRGTSRAYVLDRLDRDGSAELATKVRAGELSANAAAIEAGFRKQSTPIECALKLLPKLTPTQLKHLRARIDEILKPRRAA